MVTLQDEMGRLLDDAWRRSGESRRGLGTWFPPVDLVENENEFRIVAELPGLGREDVKISLSDNVLTLRGEKKMDTEDREQNWHHVERTYGTFERTFHLTNAVDPASVKASFENGILRILLPKAEESRPREIRIEG
jgi:HSP20 family protein